MSVKEYFDKQFSSDSSQPQADVERAEFIRDNIPDGVRTILEVGCGNGFVTRVIAKEYDVTGLELSSVGVKNIVELGIKCQQGTIAELPFSDKSFDLVLASEVLEHLDERIFLKGLSEMGRVAAKYVLITVPNRERYSCLRQECPKCRTICVPWTHIRSFDGDSLPHLFNQSGFRGEQVKFFGPLCVDYNKLIGRLLRWHRWFYNYLLPGTSCPVCGYEQAGPPLKRPTLGDLLSYPLRTFLYTLDYLAIRLSPKDYRWIFAIYKRQ